MHGVKFGIRKTYQIEIGHLLNLGMIAALNRSHEFKLHVRGALNNGLTRLQIRDVSVYK